MIEKLKEMFEGKNVATFSPGDELPGGWVECVATSPDVVEWQDHPQVKAYNLAGVWDAWDAWDGYFCTYITFLSSLLIKIKT